MTEPILVAKNAAEHFLLPQMSNRHGLIAGATGTGKTVTLQALAESFSRIGVPVFMADVKGDLAGLSQPGGTHPKILERVELLKLQGYAGEACPVMFWDVFGESGHPVRTTISEMGPLLLSRLLGLNDTQSGVLQIAFRVADEGGLLLLDMKDLRALLGHISEHASELRTTYGNVSSASVGAIQRQLLSLEQEGADRFFGEPALDLEDLMQTDSRGHGYVNVLSAQKLMQSPRVYSTMLLWLLSELFERLPEIGDPEKPRLVFFFDEAHLLFEDIPKALEDKIEQVVRLIRSKGVGVFFVTQNPRDVPDDVLGQLGNRVQHALRAFTPSDQKAVRAAAQTFRQNPKLDTETVLMQLGVGEALVSFLNEKGQPTVVERAFIAPPRSAIGTVTDGQRKAVMQTSLVVGHYENAVDRESAYEKLKAAAAVTAAPPAPPTEMPGVLSEVLGLGKPKSAGGGRRSDSVATSMAKSVVRSIGSSVGRQLVRGLMGSLFGGATRSRR